MEEPQLDSEGLEDILNATMAFELIEDLELNQQRANKYRHALNRHETSGRLGAYALKDLRRKVERFDTLAARGRRAASLFDFELSLLAETDDFAD